MSTTTKTILIVGGAAAGVYILAKALAPKPQQTSFSLFGNGAGVAQGVFSGIGSLVASLTKPSSSSSSSSGPTLPAGFDASNYTVTNNSFYTDANGNFVAG
jgi:hypothetical protein